MSKPTREQAEKAVKTLIEWAGDDPTREGLIETPKRVVKALTTRLGVSIKPSLVGSSPAHSIKVFTAFSACSLVGLLIRSLLYCLHRLITNYLRGISSDSRIFIFSSLIKRLSESS